MGCATTNRIEFLNFLEIPDGHFTHLRSSVTVFVKQQYDHESEITAATERRQETNSAVLLLLVKLDNRYHGKPLHI
jgi:hypothetical protein